MTPTPDPEVDLATVATCADRLWRWVEANDYKAYDPGDGQMSYLRMLTFGSMFLERLLTATVLRAPYNIRPILGIRPHASTKGMGYFAWGYLYRFLETGEADHALRARTCLDWLLEHRSTRYRHHCWGNDFTFTTRAGRIPCGEPTIVWSSLIGQAFVRAYEVLQEQRYLDVASSVCDWILEVPRESTANGSCLSYVAYDQLSIHNSNMLGAALLARVGALTDRTDTMEVARNAMLYSCSRQRDDGSWFYGEAQKYHWIDSFHTGYNLDSLRRFVDSVDDKSFVDELTRGYAYFKNAFIEPDGRVRYYHDRILPTDIQCLAQAIDTLALFADVDPDATSLAFHVADWTIRNMQSSDGYFYYRDLGWTKTRTPMFHWGQGTMFKALSHLLACRLPGDSMPPPR